MKPTVRSAPCPDEVPRTSWSPTRGLDEGTVYTGTEDGSIFRVATTAPVDSVGHTGGRPLGIELDADGRLLVGDAKRGLLRLDPRPATIERLVDRVAGTRWSSATTPRSPRDGTVCFSDSSTLYGIEDWKKDFVEHTRTGRLLRLDPTARSTVLLDGLAFANGVALAADESFVAVAETAARTVVRHWLTGERAGTRDLLVERPARLPRQHRAGQRRPDLGDHRLAEDPVVERLQRRPVRMRRR